MRAELPVNPGWLAVVAFAALLSIVLLVGLLVGVARAADVSIERQASCLAEFFRICGPASSEPQVRNCIASHKPQFTPACLSLAKEVLK